MLAANIPATGANVGDVVMPAVSGSLFPFPSPGIELTPDWAWLHQYPFPVLPVSSGAQIASNNEIAPFVSAIVLVFGMPRGRRDNRLISS